MDFWKKIFSNRSSDDTRQTKSGKKNVVSLEKIAWEKGKENPFTTSASLISGGGIEFICPVCKTSIGSKNPNYDLIFGGDLSCPNCESILHVPAAFFTKNNPTGLKITASVLIPISEFSDWYYAHPIFRSLIEAQDAALSFYEYYGLWAYCAKCYYRYKSSALAGFPRAQSTKKYGGQFINLASSEKSAKDMNALISGNCPSCGSENLIAIMTDIPND